MADDPTNNQGDVTPSLPTSQPAGAVMGSPTPQPQPQVNPAQVAQVAHTSRIGALAKSLLGKQYDYAVDPNTGKTVQTERKQAPGELFRHLVAGALLGGAAAAEHPSGTGFLGGFATGGAAAHQADLQADTQRRAQAQEEFRNTQERERMGMEKEKLGLEKSKLEQEGIFQKAQLAQWTANALRADREMDFQTEKFLQEQNQYNTNIQLELAKMGASPMPIMVNGKNINGVIDNGADIQKYMSDPKNRQAPEGYSMMPIMTVDTTGLTRNSKTNEWQDSAGNTVSLNDRATWRVYQIPQNTLGAPVKVKGSVLNKLTGSDLPGDATYQMPLSDYIGLNTQAKSRGLQEQAQNRADKHAELQASFDAAKIARDTANDQLRVASATLDTEGIKAANEKLDEANAEMQRVADQMNPKAAVTREKAKAEKEKARPEREKAFAAATPPGMAAIRLPNGDLRYGPIDKVDAALKAVPGAVEIGRNAGPKTAPEPPLPENLGTATP